MKSLRTPFAGLGPVPLRCRRACRRGVALAALSAGFWAAGAHAGTLESPAGAGSLAPPGEDAAPTLLRLPELTTDFTFLENTDASIGTAAVRWGFLWNLAGTDGRSRDLREAGDSPFSLSLQSGGTLAEDEEANNDPIYAEVSVAWSRLLGFEPAAGPAGPKGISFAPGDVVNRAGTSADALGAGFEGHARYETDQAGDQRNFAGGFQAFLANPNLHQRRALVPSVFASLEVVDPEENAAGEPAADAADAYGRLRLEVDWYFSLQALFGETGAQAARPGFLERLGQAERWRIHVGGEASFAFDAPDAVEEAGLDETYGGFAELIYVDRYGVTATGRMGDVLAVFVRVSHGAFVPDPEEDTMVHAGVRLSF